MLPPISPLKSSENKFFEIKSPNKKRSNFHELEELQNNLENYEIKKFKFDEDSGYEKTVMNENSFQPKKVEFEFSNEDLNSQNIFDSIEKPLGLLSYLKQPAPNNQIKSWISNDIFESTCGFSESPQLQPVRQPQLSTYEKLYSSDYDKIENELYGIKITLHCMDKGKGSVMKAYNVTADRHLWNGVENSNILVKLYMIKRLKGKVPSSQIQKVSNMLNTGIASYKRAEELAIPQAIIYNIKTAALDCCLVVEKIHGELDKKCIKQMEQVKKLFKIYFDKNIVLDLAPANLRVKTDESTKIETVKLVDYLETEQDHKRDSFFLDVLRRWNIALCKESLDLSDDERKSYAITFIKNLTEGLEVYGFDPQSIEKLL